MLCRNEEKGQAARNKILSQAEQEMEVSTEQKQNLILHKVDIANLKDISTFAAGFTPSNPCHILVIDI